MCLSYTNMGNEVSASASASAYDNDWDAGVTDPTDEDVVQPVAQPAPAPAPAPAPVNVDSQNSPPVFKETDPISWKNECQVPIEQTGYVWTYRASGTCGSSWFMSPSINEEVEKLYQQWKNGQDVSGQFVSIQNDKLNFNFSTMTQTSIGNKVVRDIQRYDLQTVNDFEDKVKQELAQIGHVWAYGVHHGKYVAYAQSLQQKMEEAYQEYLNSPANHTIHIHTIGGYKYRLDYTGMKQYNNNNNSEREIVRVPYQTFITKPNYFVTRFMVSRASPPEIQRLPTDNEWGVGFESKETKETKSEETKSEETKETKSEETKETKSEETKSEETKSEETKSEETSGDVRENNSRENIAVEEPKTVEPEIVSSGAVGETKSADLPALSEN